MKKTSTELDISQSKAFKQRVSYWQNKKLSYEAAYSRALATELVKTGGQDFVLSLVKHEVPQTEVCAPDYAQTQFPTDISQEAVNAEVARLKSLGLMTEFPPSPICNSTAVNHDENLLSCQESKIPPNPVQDENLTTGRKPESGENLFSLLTATFLYTGATVSLVYASATALGGSWQAWIAAVVMDVSLGVLFALMLESKTKLLKVLLGLATAALVYISYVVLHAGSANLMQSEVKSRVDENEEVRIAREDHDRLSSIFDSTPEDQLSKRRQLSIHLTDAGKQLISAKEKFGKSSDFKAVDSKYEAQDYVRTALIFIAMISMVGMRRGLSDPELIAWLKD